MKSAMVQDEKDWEIEYATIPELHKDPPKKVSPVYAGAVRKNPGKMVNLTEFSGFLGESSRMGTESDVSIGRYFSKRCEDVREMIQNNSPTKKFTRPIGLLTDSYRSGKFVLFI